MLFIARPGQTKYDGERTFLSAYPFLFLLAGSGFAWLWEKARARLHAAGPDRERLLGRIGAHPSLAAASALLLVFGPLLALVVAQHPHELNAYGGLVGGMRGALRFGFESTAWGGHPANLDVARWVDANLPPGATIDINSGAYGSLGYYQAVGKLRPDLRFVAGGRYWFLECAQAYASGPWWWALYEDRHPGWRRIAQFEKNGVPLLNVFEKRD